MDVMTTAIWPLFDLGGSTPRLSSRYVSPVNWANSSSSWLLGNPRARHHAVALLHSM